MDVLDLCRESEMWEVDEDGYEAEALDGCGEIPAEEPFEDWDSEPELF